MKYVFKDILINNKIHLLNARSICTEIPKQRHKTDETHRNSLNTRRKSNYDILGISRNATRKEIKTAYYSLSKACHPDVNKSTEAEDEFREITDAYEVLSNKQSRRLYDSTIGNQFTEIKPKNNADINQENLNNYRPFGKFGKNFNDSEDYLNQKWKNRRNIRTENTYKKHNESEKRRGYADPLRHDSKEYFKDHFNEEMQRQYSEQIEKQSKEYDRLASEHFEMKVKLLMILFIVALVPTTLTFIDNTFNLSDPSIKTNKTNGDSDTNSLNVSNNGL